MSFLSSNPKPRPMTPAFAERVLTWFALHGRHDLPWQHPRTPYRVWVAEVMLQQTQVTSVIPYFQRFVARFPDWHTLAAASLDDVLKLWAGLGYYARGRNLHRAAQIMVERHQGEVPEDIDEVMAMPGLGRSTAGAVLAQAFGQRHPILDGNVKRLLARHAGVSGWPGEPRVAQQLWREAQARLPTTDLVDYTQAVMDLGATVCMPRAPRCLGCPVAFDCTALAAGTIALVPASRPRRERPRRSAGLMLIESEPNQYLFERRPAAGIWGGLWCLPLLEPGEDWRLGIDSRFGLRVERIGSSATIHHAFTHFDLDLEPMYFRVTPNAKTSLERADLQWIKIITEGLPGVPAPVRKLLFSKISAEIA